MKRLLALWAAGVLLGGSLWGAVSGCDAVATKDPGVFVPNAKGTYDLQNVTEACAAQFDSVVEVVQDEKNLIIEPSSSSFTNLTGTIDSEGAITATGASTFGSPFNCTGQFAGDLVSGVCVSDVVTCATDNTGTIVCSTNSISCGFSYRRQ